MADLAVRVAEMSLPGGRLRAEGLDAEPCEAPSSEPRNDLRADHAGRAGRDVGVAVGGGDGGPVEQALAVELRPDSVGDLIEQAEVEAGVARSRTVLSALAKVWLWWIAPRPIEKFGVTVNRSHTVTALSGTTPT